MKYLLQIAFIFILSINSTTSQAQCPLIFNYGAMGSTSTLDFTGWIGLYNPSISNCGNMGDGYGDEAILKFTPPSVGKYEISIFPNLSDPYNNSNRVNLMTRPANGTCNVTGYQCESGALVSFGQQDFVVDSLTGGTTYDFLVDARDSFAFGTANVTIQCAKPSNIVITDSTSNSITISFNCNCPNTTYLEYGPPGMNPGSGGTAGTGTLISGVTSPYTISGLNSNSTYFFYLRTSCGGSFSMNNGILTRTLIDCANAPVLNCGSTFNYQNSQYAGHWMNYGCGPQNNSEEKIFRFTPTASGLHNIVLYQYSGGIQPTSIYYKPLSGNCNISGWTCAGTVNSVPPQSFSFGPLTAGVTYLILLDGVIGGNANNVFQIQCPNICSTPPVPLGISPVTSTSARVVGFCPSCTNFLIEYGSAGFTPGTSANAGAGGTVIAGTSLPFEIYGLTPAISYDVYIRQNCGAPNGYSANSGPVNFTTSASLCNVGPSAITNALGIFSTCLGSSITLNQYGGLPATGGSIKWYSGSCGGTLLGTGNSITVTPTSNTTYFVRAESPCGNSICAQKTITVNPAIQATITPASPTSFCAGGSVLLQANTSPGFTYQWKKFGNVIAGATGSSYTASTAGTYKVVVTNNMGCSLSSSSVVISVFALPTSTITAGGPTNFCTGSSVLLSANTGAGLSYQWRKYGNDIAGATASTYTATTASQYSVRVTNANGCTKNSNKITVTLIPAPTSTIVANGPTSFCAGGSVVLSANSGAGLSYQWKKGSNIISGATNIQYTATVAGNYKCTVTNSNGCTKNSNVISVTVPCRTANTDEISATRVYPNPSNGNITVELNDPEIEFIVLYDAAGKPVRKIPVEKNQNTMIIQDLSKGVYRLITVGGKNNDPLKVVVI